MRILFTPTGRRQCLSAVVYVRSDRPAAAAALRDKATRVLRRLERHPDSGRVIPEFPSLPFREVLVSSRRFFYKIDGETIWIVGVWHSAQLPSDPGVESAE